MPTLSTKLKVVVAAVLALAQLATSTGAGAAAREDITGKGKPGLNKQAVNFIKNMDSETVYVYDQVDTVAADLGNKNESSLALVQAAELAHHNLNNVRDDFLSAVSQKAPVGDYEYDIYAGVNGFKNAMGALTTYLGAMNPVNEASFINQFKSAERKWNTGVRGIWRLGRGVCNESTSCPTF